MFMRDLWHDRHFTVTAQVQKCPIPFSTEEYEFGTPSMLDAKSRTLSCLLSGAIGDALGAPIEFLSLSAIRSSFGPRLLREPYPAYGRPFAITDDTQMSLFTAEGLLRAHVRGELRGVCDPPFEVHHAYLRWLLTQGEEPDAPLVASLKDDAPSWQGGWLIEQRDLWSRRGPGNTNLAALKSCTKLGERATNDSKGCGTIMRVAPLGLLYHRYQAFEFGSEVSRLTHGHPSGYMAAGYFAHLIAVLLQGAPLRWAIRTSREVIESGRSKALEVTRAIDNALALADSGAAPTPELVESLGGGWTAEEALSIALYCALVAPDFETGLRLAVNHSGDSDSTGSLVGNLLGVMGGVEVIPARWLEVLEMREIIETIASDLSSARDGGFHAEKMAERYPGW
jgi:ADP-ribosylglycohydrolase